jgi:hypothetical protein
MIREDGLFVDPAVVVGIFKVDDAAERGLAGWGIAGIIVHLGDVDPAVLVERHLDWIGYEWLGGEQLGAESIRYLERPQRFFRAQGTFPATATQPGANAGQHTRRQSKRKQDAACRPLRRA